LLTRADVKEVHEVDVLSTVLFSCRRVIRFISALVIMCERI
jgi:hypothetical protein